MSARPARRRTYAADDRAPELEPLPLFSALQDAPVAFVQAEPMPPQPETVYRTSHPNAPGGPEALMWHMPTPSRPVDTSEEAAARITPAAGTLRRQVLAYIVAQGERGATQDECAEALGMKTQTAVARVWELEKAALIDKTTERRATRSGWPARVYRATGAGREAAGEAA